ncbi:MAG: hypothetical protein LKH29_05140 [Eggerthellaceae bacterium]|jgi:hypothetical protein|nr:hypothetical protein [Eggerthellaceae bacterium]
MNELSHATEAADDLVLDEEFDPLAATDPEPAEPNAAETGANAEEGDAFLPYVGSPDEAPAAPAPDERPAAERIADLFDRMRPRRQVFLGILRFCQTPQRIADVDAEVERLQKHDYSVYNGANLCGQLERAGALERTGSDEVSEPQLVEEDDGSAYWVPTEHVPEQWQITEAGQAYLDADAPEDRLRAKLAEDAAYERIYLQVLQMCAAEGGATAKAMDDALINDELLQKPRLYAAYFFNNLAECGALVWDGAWRITDLGRACADELAARAEA